ncbi:Uncharacterised protein [Nocardia otitidiscaviarum]|uniref:Uncharacterized protein n=1 Tax=Nocardia otitidiscaviarum TaxID=1823 RepID=A0A379JHJ0_9NOCA|nr:Uncharacterised protein [Nocardia otitidiscaviarum]
MTYEARLGFDLRLMSVLGRCGRRQPGDPRLAAR